MGIGWRGKFDQDMCKLENGSVNPPNSSCQVTDKETKITVPVLGFGQLSGTFYFRVFTINLADQNPKHAG